MRLLVMLMTLLLLIGFLGFLLTNLETTVSVTVWQTEHPNISLPLIVLIAIGAGIVYTAVIAIAEGAQIRLANRRLGREIRKLETELNYLRTQPLAPRAARELQPDTPSDAPQEPVEEPRRRREGQPPSAPVYSPDSEPWDPEDDDPADDAYSGGRAV